jgi:hypothetical protein
LLLGIVLVGSYYLDPFQTNLIPSRQGFALFVPEALTVSEVDLVLKNWGEPLVSVIVFCNCPNDAFNVIIVLPFTITSGLAEWPWPLNPAPSRWQLADDGRGSKESSIVYNSVQMNKSFNFFQTSFPVTRDYLTSKRGVQSIFIQLDTGWDVSKVGNLSQSLNVTNINLNSIKVYVTVPASAREISAFPETSSRKPLPQYLTGNTVVDSIEWDLTQRKTVTLSYVDDAEQSMYEGALIIGSLLLGAGVSGIGDWVIDISTLNRPYLWYIRMRRKVLKRIGRWRR